jgi:pantothenate kinase
MTNAPSAASPFFAELVARAAGLAVAAAAEGRRALLGITGPPAAGKTPLAEHLLTALAAQAPDRAAWFAHVPMDGFHLADAVLDRLGRRDRKGAPDTFDVAGYAALLRRLHALDEETVYAPGFARDLEQPIAGAIAVGPEVRLVVTEGNYLLLPEPGWRAVRTLLDEVWYVHLQDEVRLDRLVSRHVEFGKDPAAAIAWATGTDQRNAELVATGRDAADLLVPAERLSAP